MILSRGGNKQKKAGEGKEREERRKAPPTGRSKYPFNQSARSSKRTDRVAERGSLSGPTSEATPPCLVPSAAASMLGRAQADVRKPTSANVQDRNHCTRAQNYCKTREQTRTDQMREPNRNECRAHSSPAHSRRAYFFNSLALFFSLAASLLLLSSLAALALSSPRCWITATLAAVSLCLCRSAAAAAARMRC